MANSRIGMLVLMSVLVPGCSVTSPDSADRDNGTVVPTHQGPRAGGPAVGESMLSFTLVDECPDTLGIQARFFDDATHTVWPPDPELYVAPAGGIIQATIACQSGSRICYGAGTDPATDVSWGVGIQNAQTCQDCCYYCQTVSALRTLGCR